MTDRVRVSEVGPRDGLQNQAKMLTPAERIKFITLLHRAGLGVIECGSFVSERAVPNMAGAHQVFDGVAEVIGLEASALVVNVRGAEEALQSGVGALAIVLAATETMNRKNVRKSAEEVISECKNIVRAAERCNKRVRGYVAVAFGCPFEGNVALETVRRYSETLRDIGVDEVVLADTIGAANPRQVRTTVEMVSKYIKLDTLGLHFHDTRGMGIANAWSGLECGVRRFDSSIGGLGGCPFAPGASGNIATEDLVILAEQTGHPTGVDLGELLHCVEWVSEKMSLACGGKGFNWLRSQTQRTEFAR